MARKNITYGFLRTVSAAQNAVRTVLKNAIGSIEESYYMEMNEGIRRKKRPGLFLMCLGIAVLMLGAYLTVSEISLRGRSQESVL